MRFSLQREAFLKPLAQVVNVVERRQTLPVLANFLVQVQNGQLSLTGTDLEVEMISRSAVDDAQDVLEGGYRPGVTVGVAGREIPRPPLLVEGAHPAAAIISTAAAATSFGPPRRI